MPVRELLARADSRELAEWRAYERIEPFGEKRADYRAGMVASVMANAWKGKDQKAFTPEDFMPEYDKPQQATDWQSWRATFDMLAIRK